MKNSRIRELREARGLSRGQLAHMLAIDYRTIQYWESGRSHPTKANAQRLSRALGVRIADLELRMTPEAEREVWKDREASLTELADRVSVSNVEEVEVR